MFEMENPHLTGQYIVIKKVALWEHGKKKDYFFLIPYDYNGEIDAQDLENLKNQDIDYDVKDMIEQLNLEQMKTLKPVLLSAHNVSERTLQKYGFMKISKDGLFVYYLMPIGMDLESKVIFTASDFNTVNLFSCKTNEQLLKKYNQIINLRKAYKTFMGAMGAV